MNRNIQQYQKGSNAKSNSSVASGAKTKREKLFSTGLFAPTREGVKSIGSVQVKEDITIPAGSYLNLYEADSSRYEGNAPAFNLTVTAGALKSKQ